MAHVATWGRHATRQVSPFNAFHAGLMAFLVAALRLKSWLQDRSSYKLYEYGGREHVELHVAQKYGHDPATIRGRLAQEARIWEILGIAIAIIMTLFIVGVFTAELPDTGNSDYDNASDNVSVEIAENLELAPLVILIIIIVMIIGYVMVARRGV